MEAVTCFWSQIDTRHASQPACKDPAVTCPVDFTLHPKRCQAASFRYPQFLFPPLEKDVSVSREGTSMPATRRRNNSLNGAVSTIKFFLSEAFLGQHFEAVELEGCEPEPGDLFLFRLMSPTGRWCGAHVGVYCGQGEIIHFEGKNPGGRGLNTFLGSWEGVVYKQGQRPMLRSRSLWRVLRRRGGVDRAALERRVREAMDADPPLYHPTRSNCVHFALSLLGPSPGLQSLQIHRRSSGSVQSPRMKLGTLGAKLGILIEGQPF
ncbi:PREDICTED: uncharacterized protein LOC102840257 [Chrysochloris asiatica]|uniref:Uncharacterized protein LOC102840257 n=1 Tax=Chrysochloris asiatica TaxID=185453 RepID=A0A9B0U1Q8_CHRAS|nr:PREDICTED: uncharacterized protein LOC102840257 [Chrysochloris asiatica]